jgi:hypothetical protein
MRWPEPLRTVSVLVFVAATKRDAYPIQVSDMRCGWCFMTRSDPYVTSRRAEEISVFGE